MRCLLIEPSGYVIERDLSRVPFAGEIVRIRHMPAGGEVVCLRVEAVAHTPDDERGTVAVVGVVAMAGANTRKQRPEPPG